MTGEQIIAFVEKNLADEKLQTYKQMKERGEEYLADDKDWVDTDPQDDRENAIFDEGFFTGKQEMARVLRQFITNG